MTRNEIIKNLEGVICPVVTPFNKRGDVDEVHFRENLSRLRGIGLAGILVAGSTGEAPYLTESERLRLVELARDAVKAPEILLVGTGLESTSATLKLSRESIARGADALMILTPSYFKPQMDSAALVAHYGTVAAGVKRPVLFYYIPQYTGLTVDLATIVKISRLPNVAGLKESSGSLEFVQAILKRYARIFACWWELYPFSTRHFSPAPWVACSVRPILPHRSASGSMKPTFRSRRRKPANCNNACCPWRRRLPPLTACPESRPRWISLVATAELQGLHCSLFPPRSRNRLRRPSAKRMPD